MVGLDIRNSQNKRRIGTWHLQGCDGIVGLLSPNSPCRMMSLWTCTQCIQVQPIQLGTEQASETEILKGGNTWNTCMFNLLTCYKSMMRYCVHKINSFQSRGYCCSNFYMCVNRDWCNRRRKLPVVQICFAIYCSQMQPMHTQPGYSKNAIDGFHTTMLTRRI